MRGFVLGFCLLAATACDEKSPTGPTVPLNERFTLAPGEAAVIGAADLRVRFLRVTGDSRCPADAFCIQGGDAVVQIRVERPGTAADLDLHTGDASRRAVTHGEARIELVQLAPYPFSSQPITSDEYRATLRVTRP